MHVTQQQMAAALRKKVMELDYDLAISIDQDEYESWGDHASDMLDDLEEVTGP